MDTPDWFNTMATAAAGAGATLLAMRRKWSKDSTGIVADDATANTINMLIGQRDAATQREGEAWQLVREGQDQRIDDARKIARLEALQEAGEKEAMRLRDELFSMRIHVRKLTAIIVRLDPSAASLLNLHDDSDGIEVAERGIASPPSGKQA